MDNHHPSSSSSSPPPSPPPLLLPAPNPPEPEPELELELELELSPSPAASNPSSPDVKPKLELVPVSTPDPNPNPGDDSKSPPKKTPPLPWTHQETISLIQTYQEKWYSLKKGQLKANQWEDVAIAVAARCGYDVPSKTATQCRHKIEKLRKRYRAERLKPYPNSWQYFELMDRMERGPMPITARPMSAVKYQNQKNAIAAVGTGNYRENESDEGEGNYGGLDVKKNKLKSINNIVRGGDVDVGNNSNRTANKFKMSKTLGVGEDVRVLKGLRTPMIQKRKGYSQNYESDEDDEDDDDDDEGEELEEEDEVEEKGRGFLGKELAAEIRGFAERFMRMENKKIEMMRETERYRMEMEKKRMDKILEAQRKVVDTIGRAFGAHKKVKMAQEI